MSHVRQWEGHFVTHLKIAIDHLQDPRYASMAVFGVNFGIVEIAFRLSVVFSSIIPTDTETKKNIQRAFQIVLASAFIVGLNYAFVKGTNIKLHPLVVATIAVCSLFARFELAAYASGS